ncbi:DUF3883 domain-containing protein [Rhizobium sp. TAL182]|uniref:DUF3883 domain-containing protein n=1 Tax=Rhizobium sp. TAL182 TaxID=2020313 RepID=UPI0013DD90E7|nr:DUF3883 domain-containing protein [Rhizobium sp. TAL182]
MPPWRDDVAAALRDIGGSGSLSEIYKAVRARRGEGLPRSWQAIVRRELEYNSSDSESYKERYDLFRSVNGIGSGVWALREASHESAIASSGADWSSDEITALVDSYFDMLNMEVSGARYSKSRHRHELMKIVKRSPGAIERKHQNVSSVLHRLGYPWIEGYKPLANLQGGLAQEVLRRVEANADRLNGFVPSLEVTNQTFQNVFVDRPAEGPRKLPLEGLEVTAIKIDFAERDNRNRDLGRAGEAFVVAVERARLMDLGLADLAKKVRWVSHETGDGLGYDVTSYDENGDEIYIEVKTTRGDKYTPFYLSEAERQSALRLANSYRLYRVFQFSKRPLIYVLAGSLDGAVAMHPIAYRVTCIAQTLVGPARQLA